MCIPTAAFIGQLTPPTPYQVRSTFGTLLSECNVNIWNGSLLWLVDLTSAVLRTVILCISQDCRSLTDSLTSSLTGL